MTNESFIPTARDIETAKLVLKWSHQLIANKLTPAYVRAQMVETQDDRSRGTIERIDTDVRYYEVLKDKAIEMVKAAWEMFR